MRNNSGFTTACCLVGLIWFLAAFVNNSIIGVLAMLAGIIIWLGLIPLGIYRIVTRSSFQWKERIAPFYLLMIPFGAMAIIHFTKGLLYKSDWLVIKAHDFTGSDEFRLKKNGSFEYWHDSPLGSSVIVDGDYTRHDSTIVLQPNSADKLGDLHGFIIRPFVNDDEHLQKLSLKLIALDKQGQKVDSVYFYANKRSR
jgi:hypothetical protein